MAPASCAANAQVQRSPSTSRSPCPSPDRRQAWSGQPPEPSFTRNVPVDRGSDGRNPLSRERTQTLRARSGAGGSRCTGINQRVPVDGIEKENRRTMRKLRRLGVGSGAALLAAALIAPAGVAHANTHTVTDQYGASASSQVVDLHLLGRHVSFGAADVTSALDAVTKQVTAEAKGLGTMLVPASQAIARFNDPASVNKACALPQVDQVAGLLSGTTQGLNLPVLGGVGGLSLGGLLPKLDINVGCAEANVGGNADSFLAESVGGLLQVHVGLPEAVSGLASTAKGLLSGVGGLSVVDGLLGNATQNAAPIASVNQVLSSVLGAGGILGGLPVVGPATSALNLNAIAPALDPATTVDGL